MDDGLVCTKNPAEDEGGMCRIRSECLHARMGCFSPEQ